MIFLTALSAHNESYVSMYLYISEKARINYVTVVLKASIHYFLVVLFKTEGLKKGSKCG